MGKINYKAFSVCSSWTFKVAPRLICTDVAKSFSSMQIPCILGNTVSNINSFYLYLGTLGTL